MKILRKVIEKRHRLESYLDGKKTKSEWLILVISEGEGQSYRN